ncbi:hypothetical protein HCA61_18970 [Rhodococcus sp. HNM0563]|uniref:hypothetical protein n=1 Tax=unclassified Rhodococcus (in: high G+C Gram-positive bacteria) TaxID=192944 RepID=UPI00146A7F39|nr:MULTISPECIES: hypothetical protein [unclassified Rhodococcus (in: high G+C Gram-positive bacteria)]MCK0092563.1 hypothetical protein [Rhodococcus sp. F64268]NLU64329.1 hypothetical protein [Rhodococcus sp. HNM0563]
MRSAPATLLACLLASTLLSGCIPTFTANDAGPTSESSSTSVPSTSGPYRVPDTRLTSTIVWSAEPGIDLFSTEATLARAAIEANEIALANSVTDSYRGFARAIDQETKDQYDEFPPLNTQHFGTAYFHIMRIEPTETGFIAHSCHQTSNVAVRNTDDHYSRSVTTGGPNLKFVLQRTSNVTPVPPSIGSTSTPPVNENGNPQWQAPTYDVFTGWNINIDGSSGRDHTQACRQWGHQYAPDAIQNEYFIVTSDTPPETLPAYPGW